jgi:competence protein ComEA
VLVLGLLGASAAVLVTALSPHGHTAILAPGPSRSATAAPAQLYVHILGEVRRPGLYTLEAGARAVDLVAAAGGFTDEADPGSLNLARPLSDGEQVVILAVGARPPPGSAGPAGDGRVNLNTADLAALDGLPGIGPAKAQNILDWREANGRFASVDDLLDVPGIGASTLEQLRDLVTV